jgi:hypothetical protein
MMVIFFSHVKVPICLLTFYVAGACYLVHQRRIR